MFDEKDSGIESEGELLRHFAEAMPVLQCIVASNGAFSHINEPFASAVNCTRQDLLGRTVTDLPGDVAPLIDRLVVRARLQSDAVRGVLVSGDHEWLLTANRFGDGVEGYPVGILGFDATEQRRIQRRVAESQARLKTALEAGFDAFLALEAVRDTAGAVVDFDVVDLNANAERLLGRPRWDVAAHRLSEILEGIWGTDIISRYARVVETRLPFEEEFAVDWEQGTLWIRQQVVPLSDGVAVTARDVTDQRRAEQAIREHMRVLENALDGIATVGADGRVDFLNLTFAAMLERNPVEFVGRPWEEIVRVEDRGKLPALMERMAREERVEDELRGARADGMPLFLNLVMLPRFRDGQSDGHYVFAVDVTAHRAYEAQLELQMKLLNEAKAQLEERSAELERVNLRLRDLATTDGLTGLRNHRYFRERLEIEAARAERYGACLSVLMLDVDFFKEFNDAYGHPAGDDVLRLLAQILTVELRSTDLVARYGGEEFAIVLPDTPKEAAQILAERIRSSVERFEWPRRPITISIGGAAFDEHPDSIDGLVLAADDALYEAKRLSRNRVVFR